MDRKEHSIRHIVYEGKTYEGLSEDEFTEREGAKIHAGMLVQQGLAKATLVRKNPHRNTYQVYTR